MVRRLRIAALIGGWSPLRPDGRNAGVALTASILGSKTRRRVGFAGGAFIIDRRPTKGQRMSGTVSDTAAVNDDIATVDAASSSSFTITPSGNIAETAELDAINPQNSVSLTISGSGGASFDDCHWAERANQGCQPANRATES